METVKVALTARQRDQIKRATGKSISSLKIQPAGKVTLARGKRIALESGKVKNVRLGAASKARLLGSAKGRAQF